MLLKWASQQDPDTAVQFLSADTCVGIGCVLNPADWVLKRRFGETFFLFTQCSKQTPLSFFFTMLTIFIGNKKKRQGKLELLPTNQTQKNGEIPSFSLLFLHTSRRVALSIDKRIHLCPSTLVRKAYPVARIGLDREGSN
jgi:hypothetical protein